MEDQTKDEVKEISIIALVKILWEDRKRVLKFIGVSIVLGLIVAFVSPKEWKAESKLVVKSYNASGLSRSLGRIAGFAGLNLNGSGGGSISPMAYPDILRSDELIEELLSTKFFSQSLKDSVVLRTYFDDHMKKGVKGYITYVPKKVIGWIRGGKKDSGGPASFAPTNGILKVSAEEEILISSVKDRILTSFDEEKSIFEIGFLMQDPLIAAQVTSYLTAYLEKYIGDFLNGDELLRLKFIEEQLVLKKAAFDDAQFNLAKFQDENIDLISNRAKSEEQRLTAEFNLAFGVYNNLQQSYEEAKITEADQQQALKALGPVRIPVMASEPSKVLIMISFIFLGTVFGLGYSIIVKTSLFKAS